MSHDNTTRAWVLSLQEGHILNEDIDAINHMRAITLSREYGSGGGEIASRLAKRLGWDLIDHAIVERTAREMGTSQRSVTIPRSAGRLPPSDTPIRGINR